MLAWVYSISLPGIFEKRTSQAGVAQSVEQRIRNAKVEGSTPSTGTNKTTTYISTVHSSIPS